MLQKASGTRAVIRAVLLPRNLFAQRMGFVGTGSFVERHIVRCYTVIRGVGTWHWDPASHTNARCEVVRGAAGMRSAEQRGVRTAGPGGGAALPAGGSGSSRRWAELGVMVVVGGARKSPRPRSAEIPQQRRARTRSIPCCCSPGIRSCAARGIAACWRRGEVGCTCSEPAGRCAAKLQIDPRKPS